MRDSVSVSFYEPCLPPGRHIGGTPDSYREGHIVVYMTLSSYVSYVVQIDALPNEIVCTKIRNILYSNLPRIVLSYYFLVNQYIFRFFLLY